MRVTIRVFQGVTEVSRRDFTAPSVVIVGRHSECDVRIDGDQASRTHARLTLGPVSFIVSDTSQNGTELEGGDRLIHGHRELGYGTRLRVGVFSVQVGDVASASDTGPKLPSATPAAAIPAAPLSSPLLFGPTLVSGEEPPATAAPPSVAPDVQALRLRLHAEIARDPELGKAIGEGAGAGAATIKDVALRSRVITTLKRTTRELGADARDAVVAEVAAEAVGLGPLEALLGDATVQEIEVLDPATIYVLRGGHRERSNATFTDDERARVVLARILALAGLSPSAEGPLFDVRLPDGAHVVAVRRPTAERGTCLHVRKAPPKRLGREDAVRDGLLSNATLDLLEGAVSERRGVLVTGEAGSGRTSVLRLLANAIPANETILVLEDTSELGPWQPRVVALALRAGAVATRDALRSAAAFRPDRLVIGDCRGEEAIEVVGAPGALVRCASLAAVQAPTPEDGLATLEQLAHRAGDVATIRAALVRNVAFVVHVTRDGAARRVQAILTPWLDGAGRLALRPVG